MTIPLDVTIQLGVNNIELLYQINRQIIRVVHERDHYTCRCCGFRSTKYQEILNPGGNWRDLDTITTACIFCQQCFALDSAAKMRSGVLITFPDIEQANLNRLAVEIYLALISQTQAAAQQARACLDLFMNTRTTTSAQLGTDDPGKLAQILRDCKTEVECADINKKLAGVRLLALDRRIIREADLEFNKFPQIMAFWRSRSGPYPSSWPVTYTRLEHFAKTYLN